MSGRMRGRSQWRALAGANFAKRPAMDAHRRLHRRAKRGRRPVAMNHGLKRLEKLPVSVRLIREIYAKLLHGTRRSHLAPGKLRTRQNWIGPEGCGLKETEFVPPPDEAPLALGKLEAFLHNPGDCPALIWIGMAHAQFETIHPFLDGHGRVGRLLITFLLCEQKSCFSQFCIFPTFSSASVHSITRNCNPCATTRLGKSGLPSSCEALRK